MWLDEVEESTLVQARNMANLPFIHRHVALMPDAHLGYGMPIGGVMATKNVVVPNAVGVDIGCGMCAVQTSLTSINTDKLKSIMALIRQWVPLGFKHHPKRQAKGLMPKPAAGVQLAALPMVNREFNNARTQLGTLGGGNHFIEIQQGSDAHVWIMVHTGSRNLGYKVAQHYNRLASEKNAKEGCALPRSWQLAYLALDSAAGRNYHLEMQYCVDFAYANRRQILARIKDAFLAVTPPVTFAKEINIAHNYAALERHFHKDVMVHRKGATRARAGEIGIIPGSQGAPSYIVKGRGEAESFTSCSHGAGRKMGRKQAQRQLNLAAEQQRLDDQGIIHGLRSRRDLDEAAGAYKEIDQVIEGQLDLVEVIVSLRPLAVIKG
ncbi:MAG: RtcB family protein [Thermodesulfobacteriota bacterium]